MVHSWPDADKAALIEARPSVAEVSIARLPLLDWQRQVVAEAGRFNVVCVGRRAGKTVLGVDRCADPQVLAQPVGWFSPSYKLMLEVWREVVRLFAPVIARQNATERRLEFTTGGVLEFWSLDNPQAGRGRKYRRVIVDEAAFVPGLLDTWNYAIRPTLADLAGDAWIFSTPKGRNGFWQLWQRGQDVHEPDWRSWQMPSDVNPLLPPAELAEMRRSLPEMVARQELDAEFIDDAGGVFRRVMESATAAPQAAPIPHHEYVFGVDWGQSGDFTAVAVIDVTAASCVYLDRFNQIGYAVQMGRLRALYERFRPRVIVAEANSMGRPLVEQMQRDGLPVMPFTTTSASKPLIIDDLTLAFERAALRIIPDPVLINELQSYESQRTATGMRYNAPSGMHDDTVIALALAYYATARQGAGAI